MGCSHCTPLGMLQALRTRYENGYIYTYVGDVLISMNPFTHMGIYGPNEVEYYGLKSDMAHILEPHVYGVALRAFRAMVQSGDNQSCVISGESGAGKTEAAKYFVEHLLTLSRSGNSRLMNKYDIFQFVSVAAW